VVGYEKKIFYAVNNNYTNLIINTGCWGRTELSDLGLVTATGIDLEPDGNIRITVISITPTGFGAKGEPEKSNSWIGTATGKTLADAKNNLNETATKNLAWFHNRFIIIGENFAKHGIGDIIDHLSRGRQFRYENKVLITPTTAYDMLTIPADVEKNLVLEIEGIVNSMKEEWSKVYVENFKNILVNYCEKKSGFITGRIHYFKNENTTISTSRGDFNEAGSGERQQYVAAIKGSGVFMDEKLIGWIDGDETQAYMLIKGKARNGVITSRYNDGKDSLSYVFKRSKSKMKAEFDGNKISFNIDIKMTGRIEVLYTEQNILKEEEINKMEEAVSETVKHNLEKLIKKAQEEFEVDFLGFGEYIFRRHPKRWKEIGDRWDEIFPYIEAKYNAQAKIDNSGIISKLVIN